MAPFVYEVTKGDRRLALVGNSVLVPLFQMPWFRNHVDLIPVRPQPKDLEFSSSYMRLVQKAVSIFSDKISPKSPHQGQAVTEQMFKNLEAGNNVLLAPSGSLNQQASWKPGIIYLLRQSMEAQLEFAATLATIPQSFREKHSWVIFDYWQELVDKAELNLGAEANPHEQARKLQRYFEVLMSCEKPTFAALR